MPPHQSARQRCKRLVTLLLASTAAILNVACTTIPAPGHIDLRITNVTIVSAELAAPMPAMDVHIHNGRITAVVPTGQAATVAHQNIDGSGKFLMPGMIDGHGADGQPIGRERNRHAADHASAAQ
jgi:imidazolonepropionase-like amidohydrolase